jgi:hypothetical protein
VYASACKRRSPFEEVRAFIYRRNERYASLSQRIRIAEKRNNSGLAARILVFLVLVRRRLLLGLVLVFVIVAIYDFAGCAGEGDGFELALRLGGT